LSPNDNLLSSSAMSLAAEETCVFAAVYVATHSVKEYMMFGEFVEIFWVASAFTVGWSLVVMLLMGLPLYVLQRLVTSEALKRQAAAMMKFVLAATGLFAYLGLLGIFFGFLVSLFT
jgi:hypothetical protein